METELSEVGSENQKEWKNNIIRMYNEVGTIIEFERKKKNQ